MKEFIISWDIAKQNDATVIEFWWLDPEIIGNMGNERVFTFWVCDYIIKWEKLSYVEQVEKLALILNGVKYKNNHILLMDGTGVGQAVADLCRSKGIYPEEIIFSGGIHEQELFYGNADRRFRDSMDLKIHRGWSVPKVEMITSAKTLSDQGRITIPDDIPYAAEFEREVLHFRGQVNEKGHTTYGNDAEAKHDDFVASMLMAAWWIQHKANKFNDIEKPVNKGKKSYDWNPFKLR